MPQDKRALYAIYLNCATVIQKILLTMLLFACFYTATAAVPVKIDAVKIANYETQMWQAYYTKRFHVLAKTGVELLSVQFQLTTLDAIYVAANAATAAHAFAKLDHKTPIAQYYHDVLPSLIVMYTRLKQATHSDWDPKQLAIAELTWWMSRRFEGRGKPTLVAKHIEKLYELLYGQSNKDIKQAALLRAKAVALRDKQRQQGNINWQDINKLLIESYQALAAGIKAK